jgi:hypothetical protein
MKAIIAALALSLVACAPNAPPMAATSSTVRIAEVVKVSLKEIDNDILEFTVWNNGTLPLVVDRDAIFLETPAGPRMRVPGGIAHSYTLAPGAAHEVNVRYDWSGLRNTFVRVHFETALTILGRPLDVNPIEIRVF